MHHMYILYLIRLVFFNRFQYSSLNLCYLISFQALEYSPACGHIISVLEILTGIGNGSHYQLRRRDKSKFLKVLDLLKMSMSPEATDDTTTSHSTSNDFNIDLPLHLSISPTPVPVMQDLLIWKPQTAQIHKMYVCLNCSKRFSHQYTLDRHLKTFCGKATSRASGSVSLATGRTNLRKACRVITDSNAMWIPSFAVSSARNCSPKNAACGGT